MAFARLGIIGGSGLGDALGTLTHGTSHQVETPFGRTSGPIVTGELSGVPVALLSRHGEGHLLPPAKVPYRANLFALKQLGATHLVTTSAVGSLREAIAPRDLVVPHQLIDRTFRREGTFFEDLAAHVEFATPWCGRLREVLVDAARQTGARVHDGATMLVMEGPQFSTRAESELHRSWGADLVGMTAQPEARLAREAELCTATLALPTDYDCWRPHPSELGKHALLEEIVGNLQASTALALEVLRRAVPLIAERLSGPCACQSALELGIWSDKRRVPADVVTRLGPLVARHFGKT
jgi:5'-methylthioadenosine phosphorylase